MDSFDTLLYDGRIGRIARFCCPPWHPHFADTGPIHGTLIVFPRTSVTITHAGQQPIIGDPNVVMFYNQGQRYWRGKLSEQGDICDWFAFAPQLVIEALRPVDPRVDDRWERPFVFSHGPSTSKLYLQQRLLVDALSGPHPPDLLTLEEKMLAILQHAVQIRYQQKRPFAPKSSSTHQSHKELVAGAKAILATRYAESLSLEMLAEALFTSPYHLCRVFRQETGLTIHNYLNQMRLRASLEPVAAKETSLTELSLALGFANPSHFSASFRRAFGVPPSHLRQKPSTAILQKMSKILTV
ncbi:MAG: helix-turn-helix transcriptional regulator [Ardenticatenaceae bacterium]|nr:helix-turn-helix transcriptional regulator [Ardenticatenaceae bacterium]MCB8949959.1 helix-turn-helix transcriptional regulator [Ardenticatenaceae bacterium]